MRKETGGNIDRDMPRLLDGQVHGTIDRREFLERTAGCAAGGMTAALLSVALSPEPAEAQALAKDDPRLKTEVIEYPSPQGSGKMKGYLCRPAKAPGRLPGIVVIHENRGLNPHIEDVARRFAVENYLVLAPDALTPLGGYPAGGEDEARQLFPKLDREKTREDMAAAVAWIRTRPECTGKVGVVGFCWGGGIVNILATRIPELSAAVPYYGSPPHAGDVSRIKTPLLIHYAEKDSRINAMWPEYEAALKAAGVQYAMHMYPGAQHGFNNDTTPRYDEASAKLAWQRTLEFFNKRLR